VVILRSTHRRLGLSGYFPWARAALLPLLLARCGDEPTSSAPPSETEAKSFDRVTVAYQSAVLGQERPLAILLPSDYDDLHIDLPVLYLLHGWDGNEYDWTDKGFATSILGHFYDDGTIVPMLVVMPDNVLGESALADGPDTDPFLREIQEDIIPFVESHYRVSSARSARAIAGLSAGGIQTLNLTLFYPDLWGYSFPMSAAYFTDALPKLKDDYTDLLDIASINEITGFELGIGTEDVLFYIDIQSMRGVFDDLGIHYTYYETSGGHTWEFWRACLTRIAPLLFQN
jgi:enterochelin esterase-like enzyme